MQTGSCYGFWRSLAERPTVQGVEELKLVAADAGDFVDDDHAEWAGARLTCSGG